MTKEQLREMRRIKFVIRKLEAEAAEIYDTIVKAGLDFAPVGKSYRKSDPTASLVEKAAHLHTQLLVRRCELIDYSSAVNSAFKVLDSCEYEVMHEYYINGLQWNEVAAKLNYSERAVYYHHGHALQKLSGIDEPEKFAVNCS